MGLRTPIMSAKGGVDMDKFLKSFYDEHFASREINNIANTAEYKNALRNRNRY